MGVGYILGEIDSNYGKKFQSRGRFLGVGYGVMPLTICPSASFNRGGDSWGWAT